MKRKTYSTHRTFRSNEILDRRIALVSEEKNMSESELIRDCVISQLRIPTQSQDLRKV